MERYSVTWKTDLQCIAFNDVVSHLKETVFPNGIGKPLVVTSRCQADPDGLTVSLTYHLNETCPQKAAESISELMDFDELENDALFSIIDLQSGEASTIAVLQDGTGIITL